MCVFFCLHEYDAVIFSFFGVCCVLIVWTFCFCVVPLPGFSVDLNNVILFKILKILKQFLLINSKR
jgi:hypothetical protein